MSQYGQVTKRHTFHGFARLVFWLHTAGTENPDTPKTQPSAYNFNENHSEHPQTPPRHPPDTPHTETLKYQNLPVYRFQKWLGLTNLCNF